MYDLIGAHINVRYRFFNLFPSTKERVLNNLSIIASGTLLESRSDGKNDVLPFVDGSSVMRESLHERDQLKRA